MDEVLLLAINGLRAPGLDAVMKPLSSWGIYAFPLAMLFSLIRSSAHARSIRDGWLTWFLSMFVAEQVLKPLIARPRPTAGERLRDLLDVLGSVPRRARSRSPPAPPRPPSLAPRGSGSGGAGALASPR